MTSVHARLQIKMVRMLPQRTGCTAPRGQMWDQRNMSCNCSYSWYEALLFVWGAQRTVFSLWSDSWANNAVLLAALMCCSHDMKAELKARCRVAVLVPAKARRQWGWRQPRQPSTGSDTSGPPVSSRKLSAAAQSHAKPYANGSLRWILHE